MRGYWFNLLFNLARRLLFRPGTQDSISLRLWSRQHPGFGYNALIPLPPFFFSYNRTWFEFLSSIFFHIDSGGTRQVLLSFLFGQLCAILKTDIFLIQMFGRRWCRLYKWRSALDFSDNWLLFVHQVESSHGRDVLIEIDLHLDLIVLNPRSWLLSCLIFFEINRRIVHIFQFWTFSS